jgi:hypothetical protein
VKKQVAVAASKTPPNKTNVCKSALCENKNSGKIADGPTQNCNHHKRKLVLLITRTRDNQNVFAKRGKYAQILYNEDKTDVTMSSTSMLCTK